MIDVLKLKSEIVKKGMTQQEFCKRIGMAPSTFIRKLKTGIFKTNEVSKIMSELDLKKPEDIFFAT